MCAHYEAPNRKALQTAFPKATLPDVLGKEDVWPGYMAPFIRRPPELDSGDDAISLLQVEVGNFGLIPSWTGDDSFGKRTYNARTETIATKPAFRDAWKKAQHCIIPATAIYEPDWRTGNSVPTRVTRADGGVLGIAGLYERRRTEDGQWAISLTMLTLNEDEHRIFKLLHRPDPKRPSHMQDKRMVVVLPMGLYDAWLDAPVEASGEFLRMFPAPELSGMVNGAPINMSPQLQSLGSVL